MWRFLKNLKIKLPYDPTIPLLNKHPGKTKILIWKDVCTPMFLAALFTIAKTRKQPGLRRCGSLEDTHTHTYEYIHYKYIHTVKYCVCSVMFDALWPHVLWTARLLFSWDFPGKNKGVSCHFLLQGIFSTQGLNLHFLCLLHFRQILYLEPSGKFKGKKLQQLSSHCYYIPGNGQKMGF